MPICFKTLKALLCNKNNQLLIPHSQQNLSCLRSGVDYSQIIGSGTAEE